MISRDALGAGLVILAAMSFSMTSVATVIAYEGGANPNAVIMIRFLGAIVVLSALLLLTGASMRLSTRDRTIAFAVGALQALQSFFLYTSFAHISIALTMIIFYCYPLIVAVVATVIGQDRLTWKLGGGLLTAFVGLVLVLNVTGEGLNTTGVVYAIGAALSWSALIVISTTVIRDRDSRPVTLHTQISAAALFGLFLIVSGDTVLPTTFLGWAGFWSTPLFYAVSIISLFAAVSMIGSLRATLIMNFEPVATITLGYFVLGQTLTPLQLLGAAFVIVALLAVKWRSSESTNAA